VVEPERAAKMKAWEENKRCAFAATLGEPGAKRRPPADPPALRLPALSALMATLLCAFTNCERDASDAGEVG
jgi:hypothetical protein